MTAKKYKRRRKLIEPALQLKLVSVFVGLAACSIVLQMLLLSIDIKNVARNMPEGAALEEQLPGILQRMFLFSAGMWLPVTIAVGIVVTHRIAGPVFRFKQHLDSVAKGEVVGACRIRKRDELHGLCDSLNRGLAAAYASVPPSEETVRKRDAEFPATHEEAESAENQAA